MACLLGCAAMAAAAGAKSSAWNGLERIKKMAVAVSLDRTGGLDAADLRTNIEQRLRSAGIQIDPKSRHCLHVNVAVFEVPAYRDAPATYAYSIHITFNQQVYLASNPNIMTQAATWETMSMRVASGDRLRAACVADIARRVDEFLEVYRSVNEGN